jgi:hypothetical protein
VNHRGFVGPNREYDDTRSAFLRAGRARLKVLDSSPSPSRHDVFDLGFRLAIEIGSRNDDATQIADHQVVQPLPADACGADQAVVVETKGPLFCGYAGQDRVDTINPRHRLFLAIRFSFLGAIDFPVGCKLTLTLERLRLDVLLSDRADDGVYALFVVFSLFSPKVRKSRKSLPPPDLVSVSCCLDGVVHGTPKGCSRWRYTGVYGVRFVLRAGVSEQ